MSSWAFLKLDIGLAEAGYQIPRTRISGSAKSDIRLR